jgi:hypothetical protein
MRAMRATRRSSLGIAGSALVLCKRKGKKPHYHTEKIPSAYVRSSCWNGLAWGRGSHQGASAHGTD